MADGLLNKASIILTPTGYKAGTLYNVAPVVEPYEDFDFARASVASRVNSSGLVEMVGRTLSSELITDGSFPDGTTAWTFSNPGGTHGWRIADGKAICDTNAATANRNLSSSLSLDSSKDYKLTIDILQSADNITVYVGGTALSPKLPTSEILGYEYYISSSDHSGGVLMFYAGSSDLQEIDNVSVKEVIDTNNIPRISYDSNGDNGHILLEPTSTNKVTYSENFTQWIKTSGVTITSNYGISPDGTQNSTRLQLSSNNEQVYKSISHSGNTETATLFVKGTSGETIQFGVGNNISQGGTYTLNGQWQRIEQQNTSGSVFIIGNKDLTATDFEVWGAQLEALPYSTSYIPSLTGSQETRATETATGAGSADLINSTEGVLYAEIARAENDTNAGIISLNDGSNSNLVSIYYFSNDKIAFDIFSSSPPLSQSVTTSNTSNFNKIALKYKSGDIALWVNGVQVITRTETISLSGLNNLDFRYGNNTFTFYGKCKALAVFKEALSDSELTQLTT